MDLLRQSETSFPSGKRYISWRLSGGCRIKIKFCIAVISLVIAGCCFFSLAANAAAIGEIKTFNIDPSYDISNRDEISSVVLKISAQLYFYADISWWEKFAPNQKEEINSNLSALADEFEKKIYQTITSNYGFEWKPGIDNDERITVLIHPMKKGAGGYFNSGNEYSKLVVPASNEREMIYINSDYISSYLAKGFLAHEFTHLVTFNQKEKIYGIEEEEVWLNEARAEYASTLCGYDSDYQTSNLRRRVVEFLKNPSDSLTDWQGTASDYGVLNLFTQYLVDYYGVKILNDSLHSNKKGIESINYALAKNGYKACPVDSERSEELCGEDFSKVFTDWTITILVNNCSLGSKYCYKNENLKNVRVFPESNFLPTDSTSILSVNYTTKSWAGYWNKILGGGGTLVFEFDGSTEGNFKIPYLLCDSLNKCFVGFLALDKNQDGKIILEDFNKKYSSLTIIPSVQNDKNGSNYYFSWRAAVNVNMDNKGDEELIKKLLEQIDALKAQITVLQSKINSLKNNPNISSCSKFENNLYFGIMNNQEVSCLQGFLKKQGEGVYPEGLVTGNFFNLTKSAIIRFQEKYSDEILKPLGLSKGTGYVGLKTREKINKLLSEFTN